MSEKKKSSVEWLKEFSQESLELSSEMEIKPKLTVNLGIENAVDVIILSEPYKVEIPKEKAIGSNKIWMIDLEYNSIAHSFIAQSGSFRYQLGVIMTKLDIKPIELIGIPIRLWKTLEQINTPTFKGKAEMYHVSIM